MAENFQAFGDWKKIANLLNNIKTAFDEAGKETLQALAQEGEKFAVKSVKDQSLGWAPLNPQYLKGKIKRGESNKILIASSSYFQAISSWVAGRKASFVGVRRTVMTRDAKGKYQKGKIKSKIADIATILEYGSVKRGIPARPLWGPTALHVRKFEQSNQVTRTKLRDKLLPLFK